MSCLPSRRSSSSEGDSQPVIDEHERKRKRMLSNRESARRSRMRKQQHLKELMSEEEEIKSQNAQISMQIPAVTQQYMELESDNAVLRVQIHELTQRLQSINSMLRNVAEVSGMTMDTPEMPDPLLKPWQIPCLTHPIMANAQTLQF
ncbi:bZIP transcription factor 53-like [Zingiber officinale]|nr:bZIP transcription factor 53-like [Zingiber officinale]